jgi:hypothetical protein
MRKTTQQAINAFMASKSFKMSNTEVVINEHSAGGTITQLYLHNNLIAEHSDTGLRITNAGWQSNTTKERLNGLPGVCISQKKGQWYLNGKEWNGEWITI